MVAIDRVEKVGVLSRSEVLRVKGIKLVYVAQPKVEVKSKQLNDIAELMAKGEYYFSLAEADAEAEDLTLSFLNEIRGLSILCLYYKFNVKRRFVKCRVLLESINVELVRSFTP